MFYKGELIRNIANGVTGSYLRVFRTTGVGEIIVAKCGDGRQYRAPEDEWESLDKEINPHRYVNPEIRGEYEIVLGNEIANAFRTPSKYFTNEND